MKTVLAAVAAVVLFGGAARASDVSFAGDAGSNVKVAGTVDVDDSSGDILSVAGDVSGPVSGKYNLDRINTRTEITGGGYKLTVILDRGDQQINARLDTCETGGSCTMGSQVTLWEK